MTFQVGSGCVIIIFKKDAVKKGIPFQQKKLHLYKKIELFMFKVVFSTLKAKIFRKIYKNMI